jgi:Leucine-rich repeat (LRR) protein
LTYNGKDEKNFPIESLNSQETIEELTIKNTDFSQLPETFGPTLRSMKSLKTLDLKYNWIRSVEAFVDLPNVESIDLSESKIVKLPANAFKGCPRLMELNLFDNKIEVLRGDEFNQLSGLKELVLSPTKLSNIPPTTFHQLRALEKLVLTYPFSYNNVIINKELFKYSTNLRSLRLDGNNIQAIHPEVFDGLNKLTFLNLRGNKCVDEKFEAPKEEVLDIALVKEKLQKCFANFAKQKTS